MSQERKPGRRKPLFWAGVTAAAAAAVFAAGTLAGHAMADPGESQPEPAAVGAVTAPGFDAADRPVTMPSAAPIGAKETGANDGGFGSASVPRFDSCRAPLPVGVMAGNGIDLAKAGFVPRLPSAGLAPLSASVAVYAGCDDNGQPLPNGELTLDTAWQHEASGLEAYVSQRKSATPAANVLRDGSATFWADGYRYDVNVNSYAIPAAIERGAPAQDLPSGPVADPRVAGILQSVVSELMESADATRCFWTLGQGSAADLAALGIGDPSPAIPAGYNVSEFNITRYVRPPADCDASIVPTEGTGFYAGWTRNSTPAEFGYLGVSVSAMPEGYNDPWPGSLTQYGANWSNGKFQFGVYAKVEGGLSVETIRAIARALDPSFNEACLIQERQLSAADLARLGFRTPVGPDGYAIIRSSTVAQEIGDGCPKPQGWEPSYNLSWTLERGPDTIEASASRYGGSAEPAQGFIGPNAIWWTDTAGTHFSVNAYSRGVSAEVARADLIAVARSMDPTFDESKLSDGGAKPVVDVAPVVPQAAGESR